MPGVLTLDLATRTGWALFLGPGRIHSGVYEIPGGRPGRRWRAFGFWLDSLLQANQVERIVFEAPINAVGQTTLATTKVLTSLVTMTELVAEGRDVAYVEPVNNSKVRAHFLGSARGGRDQLKAATMETCRRLGWRPRDDNEGDALAILHWALHHHRYDHGLPTTALFARGRAA